MLERTTVCLTENQLFELLKHPQPPPYWEILIQIFAEFADLNAVEVAGELVSAPIVGRSDARIVLFNSITNWGCLEVFEQTPDGLPASRYKLTSHWKGPTACLTPTGPINPNLKNHFSNWLTTFFARIYPRIQPFLATE